MKLPCPLQGPDEGEFGVCREIAVRDDTVGCLGDDLSVDGKERSEGMIAATSGLDR